MSEVKQKKLGKFSFNSLFKVFLRTDKRRIVFTILTSVIVFTLLLTFLMAWYNYQYISFQKILEARSNWRQDNYISISTGGITVEDFEDHANYFELAVHEAIDFLDEEIPGLVTSYTTALSASFYNYINLSDGYWEDEQILGLSLDQRELLTSSLIEGRLPVNQSELLFIPNNTTNPEYAVNDTIHLRVSSYQYAEMRNFTISGILQNIENRFYNAGYSSDIFKRYTYYNEFNNFEYDYQSNFITTTNYLSQIITGYIYYQGNIELNIDLDYYLSPSNIRNLDELVNTLSEFRFGNFQLEYLPPYIDSFCNDLIWEIRMFLDMWSYKTVMIFASGIPLIFIFALICTETFHIGDHEKAIKFKLIKLHGLEFKTLRRMLFLENLIISSIGLGGGTLLGLLFGYFFAIGMGTTNLGIYLSHIAEPVIIIAIFALYTALLFVGFIIENSLAKKSAQTTADIYKSKRKKLVRKIFTAQEFLVLLPGLILAAIGFTGMMLWEMLLQILPQNILLALQVTFIFLMAVGALFAISAVFMLLSRFIRILWRLLGKFIWKNRKSYFTLSMKHLSIYHSNYTRSILVMFMICLAVTPGLISKKSVDEHVPFEAELSTGCADIVIFEWNSNFDHLKTNISEIEGVEIVTGVSSIRLFEYNDWQTFERGFEINIMNIHNVSEYVQIFNQDLEKRLKFTASDIAQLEKNMTYMMSKKFAKIKNYDRGEVFLSSKFTNPRLDPFELIYVNSFEYFPLMNRPYNNFYSRFFDVYSLVVSNLTFSQLTPRLYSNTNAWGSSHLLIKTSENANITKIQESIQSITGYPSFSKVEKEADLFLEIDSFQIAFFIIVSIVAMLALVFFGYITAKNIYSYRLRIIESEYQVGAQRQQIWGSFTIEFLLIIVIPVILSTVLGSVVMNYALGPLLSVEQYYLKFEPWNPFWLMLLIIVFSIVVITTGWLVEIIIRVNKYRPIKQE